MQRYEVSFRIYGKALKVNVMAQSHADAKHKVVEAIQFDKVERRGSVPAQDDTSDPIDYLKGIFGMK